MNLGVYLDLRNPSQWYQDPSRLYSFTIEMCEEAERFGLHSAWFTEHHLFEDGYLTQPLTIAAAVASRTSRIRLGTAVVLAPIREAVHIAEEAAIVDIISGGRLDLGLGAGYRLPEFELFDADRGRRFTTTERRVIEIRRLWEEGRIKPLPVQARLPIWLGFNGPQGAARAGRLGENLLSADPRLWSPYRDAWLAAGHDPRGGRMAGLIYAFVSDDPERDWALIRPHVAYQFDSYRQKMIEQTVANPPRPVDPDILRSGEMGRSLGYFICTTPEDMASRVKSYAAGAPVETVFFFLSVAGLAEDVVTRHLRAMARLSELIAEPPATTATAD